MGRFRKILWATPLLAAVVAALATGAIGLAPFSAPKCKVFPRSNPWNQRVDHLPVSRRSDTYIDHLGRDAGLFADVSVPFTAVPKSQRKVRVRFEYRRTSDHVPYPIPPDAPIEEGEDDHVIVIDRDRCRLYELYDARPIDDGADWEAVSGATWNLRSNRLRPRGWTSADAAGLPIFAGLIRYDEVNRGRIDHALRFTAYGIRDSFVYPARHSDGDTESRSAPPMGTRFRLRPSFDTSRFPRQSRVILKALKRYGMFLADTGKPYLITGAPSDRWNYEDLESLERVKGSDLQVVDTRKLPKPGR